MLRSTTRQVAIANQFYADKNTALCWGHKVDAVAWPSDASPTLPENFITLPHLALLLDLPRAEIAQRQCSDPAFPEADVDEAGEEIFLKPAIEAWLGLRPLALRNVTNSLTIAH